MKDKDNEGRNRHQARGTLIIIALAMIFFTLLGLLILYWPRRDPATSARSATLIVIPLELKIRTQPGGQAPVVATVARGKSVRLEEVRGAWVRVTDQEGLGGWTERNLLETEVEHGRRLEKAEAIRELPPLEGVVDEATQLFAGPGIFYPEIGEVARGEKVRVFTRDHDFFAIDLNGEIVYLDASDVDITGTRGARYQVAASEESEAPDPIEDWPFEGEDHPLTPDFVPAEPDLEEPVPTSISPVMPDGVFATVPRGGTEPQLLERVTPQYPISARRSGIEGSVIIRAIVRRDGSVDSGQILKDLPFGLGQAALEAVERWRFRPATVDGQPVDVYYTVTVNYSLRAQ